MNLIILIEHFMFKHNKYCNVTMTTILNVLLNMCALALNSSDYYYRYAPYFSLIMYSIFTLLNGIYLTLVVYDNKDIMRVRIDFMEFIQYWYCTLVYFPCSILYACCYDRNGTGSDTSNDVRIETKLQISYPRYVASIIARFGKFTVSHHQSHYNAIIWIEAVVAIFSILVANETVRFIDNRIENIETHTASPTLSPTYSPTYTIDSPTPIPTVGPTLYPTYAHHDDWMDYYDEIVIDHGNKLKPVLALILGILYLRKIY